ncbi:S1 family peptidase [Lentzea sp. JNUCC 0626]|uniref:S1 family peptidase n=1 Tax=Lentzea sp. JNUCC 0626 TaxID=3367513 RepID=UPI00374A12AE
MARALKLLIAVTAAAATLTASYTTAAAEQTFSATQLAEVKASLDDDPELLVPGTAWHVDHEAGRVLVTYYNNVTGTQLAEFTERLKRYGDAVQVVRVDDELLPAASEINGGNEILVGNSPCSLGFNTVSPAGTFYFLTAGHCGHVGDVVRDKDGNPIGTVIVAKYGTDDYAVVKYNGTSILKYGRADLWDGRYQDITTSREAKLGEKVCRSGKTTHLKCGLVKDLHATVTYRDGTRLHDLIASSACAQPGDSGGPVWHGTAGLGLHSGGPGQCPLPTGANTYVMKLPRVLARHGVNVY